MTPERSLFAARSALDRGNAARALEHVAEAAAFDEPETYRIQSEAHLALDNDTEALHAAQRGLVVEPTDTELQILLGRAHSALDDHRSAETAYLSVLNQDPQNVHALFHYSWTLAHVGDSDGAREILAHMPPTFVAASPDVMALHAYLAMIDGNKKEAEAFIEHGLALDPQHTSMRRIAGVKAQLDGNMRGAGDHYMSAAQVDPGRNADVGREGMYLNHPLMAPTRLITRIGPGRLWVGWIVFLVIGRRVLPTAVMLPLIVIYVVFALYSWVVPPLLRKWLKSRGEL